MSSMRTTLTSVCVSVRFGAALGHTREQAMDRPNRMLSLTPAHVALVHRKVEDIGPPPGQEIQTDSDYAEWVSRIAASQSRKDKPLHLFAYGSLIWRPEIEHVGEARGVLRGWHRSFCLRQYRFRGTPESPGLMLALDEGGECEGVIFELPSGDLEQQLDRLFRREFTVKPNTYTPCWMTVDTEAGPIEVLVFVMNRLSSLYAGNLAVENVAATLAKSCGHLGTGAEYLLNTVVQLEQRGIHDPYLWRLQELVAECIGTGPQSSISNIAAI